VLEKSGLPYIAVRRGHAGMDTNINAAILLARGNWIAFLASDDAFPRNSFEILLNAARREDADVAIGAVQEMAKDGTPGMSRSAVVARYRTLAGDAFRQRILEEHGSLMVQGMLVSRRVFASVGMLATDLVASDFDFLVRMAARPLRFAFTEQVTALHRKTRDVLSRRHIEESLLSHLRIARQHARSEAEYRRSSATFYCEAAANSLHYGYRREALLSAGRALQRAPIRAVRYFASRLMIRLRRKNSMRH
jgi:GT2 family glycosyltransferase